MGSYMFFAPEMFATNAYNDSIKPKNTLESMNRGEKTDIWALGISIYYMLSGQYPYQNAISPL